MAEVKAKVGKIKCLVCAEPGWLRANGAGTVSFACTECDLSLFAKRGTDACARLSAQAGAKVSAPAPAPGPAPLPKKDDPVQAKKSVAAGFWPT